jgi:gluconate 2-dehydrogenase gamma chain
MVDSDRDHSTSDTAKALTAIAARLIPSDEHGGGAAEANAAGYIIRSLAAERAYLRETYRRGIATLDTHCIGQFGAAFSDLEPTRQDATLAELESGNAPWFGDDASAFFELVRSHVIEGTFCDPRWDGNAGRAGWDLLGYRGPKFVWEPRDQAIDELAEGRPGASDGTRPGDE